MKKYISTTIVVAIIFLFNVGVAFPAQAAKKAKIPIKTTLIQKILNALPKAAAGIPPASAATTASTSEPEATSATSSNNAATITIPPVLESVLTPAPEATSTPATDTNPTSTPTTPDPAPVATSTTPEPQTTPTTTASTTVKEESPKTPLQTIKEIFFPAKKPSTATSTATSTASTTALLPSLGTPAVVGSIYSSSHLTVQQTEVLVALAATLAIVGIFFAEGNTLERLLALMSAPRVRRSRSRA